MKKYYVIAVIFLMLLISCSAVHAEGNSTGDYQKNVSVGDFKSLDKDIQNTPDNTIIKLEKDYVFNETSDDKNLYKYGININRSITIEGNNHVIDAKNCVRIFNINSDVVIRNLVLVNGYRSYDTTNTNGAGAINVETGGIHLENCILFNNTAYTSTPVKGTGLENGGGAICANNLTYVFIDNCTFLNNSIRGHSNIGGGAIMFKAGSAFNVTNSLFMYNGMRSGEYMATYGGAIAEIHVEQDPSICTIVNCTFINNTGNTGSSLLVQSAAVIGNQFINSGIAYHWGARRVCEYNSFINCGIDFLHMGQGLVKQNWYGVNPSSSNDHIVAEIINDGGKIYVSFSRDGAGNNITHPENLNSRNVRFIGDVKYDNVDMIAGVAVNEMNETLKEGYLYAVNATVDNQFLELYFKYVENNNFTYTIPTVNESYAPGNAGEFKIKGSDKIYHSLYEAINDALLMDGDATIYVAEGTYTEKWSDKYYNYEYMNYNFDITSNDKTITIIGAGNDKSIFKGETAGLKISGNSIFRFVNITFADFTDNVFTFNSINSNVSFTNCIFRNISTDRVICLGGENSTLFIDGCYFEKVTTHPFWNVANNSYVVIDSTFFDRTNYDYMFNDVYTINDYKNHIMYVYHNLSGYYVFNHNFLVNSANSEFDCSPYIYLSNRTINLGDSVDIVADFNYFSNESGRYHFNSNFIDDFTVYINTASGSNKVNLHDGIACLKYTPTDSGVQTIIVRYGGKNVALSLHINPRQAPTFSVEGTDNIVATLPSDAKGNVIFNVNGNEITKEVINGTASIDLSPLSDIKYAVDVRYSGDTKYMSANTTLVFSPIRDITQLDIKCSDAMVYGDFTIDVYTNANGTMKLMLGGVEYTTVINNNVASFNIKNLTAGIYDILAIYEGNRYYLPENTTGSINIIKYNPTLTSYVKTVLSSENVIMNITLNDDITSEVYVFVKGKAYKTTVVNGVGYLNFTRLHGGDYDYRLYFNGNDKYYPSDLNGSFTVIKLNVIYVDGNNGNDENMGTSRSDALKTLKCALECIRNGGTIYMYDGIYSGVDNVGLTVTQSASIVGLGDVVFDAQSKSHFLKIDGGLKVQLKNIVFKNMKDYGIDISRVCTVNVENCTFLNGRGNVLINNGDLTVTDSTFKNFNSDAVIINYVTLNLHNSTFDSLVSSPSKGLAVSNYGTSNIDYCTFKDSSINGDERVYGLVYNEGAMSLDYCLFDSNTAAFIMHPIGTANIYNVGELNATYNVFMKTKEITMQEYYDFENHIYVDLYNDISGSAYVDYNWWDCIESPYELHLINVKPDLWIVPDANIGEYVPLDIGDNLDVIIHLSLNNGSYLKGSGLPLYEASFDGIVNQINNYVVSYNFNKTSAKASFNVPFIIGGLETSYLIEVGKNYSYMDVNKSDIGYGQTLQIKINVSSDTSIPTGIVTVILGNNKYNSTLANGYASFNINKLMPGTYDLKVIYEGNDDFFKNYYYGNVTVFKQKTQISIDLEDIMVGQKGVAHISIEPNTLVNALGYIYIDGVRRNIYFYQGKATYELKKFDLGQYDIKVEFLGNNYYYPSNASTLFNVHKYRVNLTLSIDDIHVGERAYLYISKDPSDLSGDVHFIVEGTTQRDDYAYLSPEQSETRITLKNLGGGTYNITVFYDGDSKYDPFNTTISFTVIKYTPDFNVMVTHNDTNAHFDFNLTSSEYSVPIGGVIQFWHNDNITYINVTDGYASHDINLTEGYNYLFAYYMGDANYNYSLWNSTIVINIPFVLTGEDVVMNVGDNKGYTVNLTTPYGRPLVNQSIIFNFTGDLYRGFTDGNGSIFFPMDYLDAGIYNITVLYNETSINNTITVLKNSDYPMEIEFTENGDGDEIVFIITLPNDATGNVTINGNVVKVVDGKAELLLSDLPAGNQTFYINYSGDRKYENKSENITINVGDDKKTILKAPNIEMYYHDGTRFEVLLTDRNSNPLAAQTVTININGVGYNVVTKDDGKASIALNLASGRYTVFVSFESDDYTNSYANSTVFIKPTVEGWDLTKVFRNSSRYVARFYDFNGNLLTSGEAIFNINGIMYKRNINSEGLASLAINLDPNKYVITTTNPVTGEMVSNTVTVLSCVVENHDLVKYYKNDSKYTVRALDSKGNPVGAGEYVVFNINGVYYARQTDDNGYASLAINLNPGDYIITAEYNFCKVSNNIKVRPILSAYNLVKKSGTSNPFRAFLLDSRGRPLEGATVTFNVNGVFYERITDIDGVAKLNINLMPGRYIITSMYNGASISNNITIA